VVYSNTRQAIIRIQSSFRRFSQTVKYQLVRSKLIKLQATFRAYRAKQSFLAFKFAAIQVNPQPSPLDPQPSTLNPKLSTLNP